MPLSDWRVAWVTAEIDQWVDAKIAARATAVASA
ncbi:hypothetical protein [Bradyrhizobium sp. AZCC 1678]